MIGLGLISFYYEFDLQARGILPGSPLPNPENSQADAYKEAYNTPEDTPIEYIYQRASRLMANTNIKARITELRTAEYLSQPWSVDRLRATLEYRSTEAADDGQYGPSIRALEMIGKLDGLLVDRKEITGVVGVVGIELSSEELRQLVAAASGPGWDRSGAADAPVPPELRSSRWLPGLHLFNKIWEDAHLYLLTTMRRTVSRACRQEKSLSNYLVLSYP